MLFWWMVWVVQADLCTLRIFPYFIRKKSENTEIRIHTTESDFLWGWNTENPTSPACFPIASSASLASGHCTSELPRTPRLRHSAHAHCSRHIRFSLRFAGKWPAKNVKKQRSPKLGTMVVNESENQMKVFQLVPKRSSWKNIEQLTQTRGCLFCQVLSMVEGESKARQFFPPQDTGYIGYRNS